MNVLVTCPPMLGQLELLQEEFDSRGWNVTAPDVVQTLSVEELRELVPNHDGWIIGDDPACREVVEAAAKGSLKAAVKWGVGTDNIDFEAFADARIPVTHTPGMFGPEVADIALGYIIALARHTFEIHQGVIEGRWPKPSGSSLEGKTVGLIGYGDIGQHLAARLQACGLKIQIYDPAISADRLPVLKDTVHLAWPEQLHACDYLCFTCALTPENVHMLNDETLSMAKPGVRIINVARGPLIDEAALIRHLASGRVAAAALDVFEAEPLAMASRLRGFPQNVFGSHNASNTLDAVLRTSHRAINLLHERLS